MALNVMYGENCFRLVPMHWAVENKIFKNNDPEDDDLEDDDLEDDDLEDDDLEDDDSEDDDSEDDDQSTVDIETLKHSAWLNLKTIPHTLFGKVVSSVDCLDMISQTSSGQKFVKQLRIDFGRVAWMRVMDGVLLRILKRMRGLQSVELDIYRDWEDLIPIKEDSLDDSLDDSLKATEIWHERNARDFLILVREKLSHIKKITMGCTQYASFDDTTIIDWMTDELKKRNEAWAPPLPSYKNFRRTLSPLAIVDADVAKSVAEFDDKYRFRAQKYGFGDSERLRRVF